MNTENILKTVNELYSDEIYEISVLDDALEMNVIHDDYKQTFEYNINLHYEIAKKLRELKELYEKTYNLSE